VDEAIRGAFEKKKMINNKKIKKNLNTGGQVDETIRGVFEYKIQGRQGSLECCPGSDKRRHFGYVHPHAIDQWVTLN